MTGRDADINSETGTLTTSDSRATLDLGDLKSKPKLIIFNDSTTKLYVRTSNESGPTHTFPASGTFVSGAVIAPGDTQRYENKGGFRYLHAVHSTGGSGTMHVKPASEP